MAENSSSNGKDSRDTESLGRLLIRFIIPALIILMTWVLAELHDHGVRMAVMEHQMMMMEMEHAEESIRNGP